MTIPELNELPFITLNIDRIMRQIETENTLPGFFLQVDEEKTAPIMAVLQAELKPLVDEYRRRMKYIEGITDPWMQHIFEQRFLARKTFREIGTECGITSGTLKQEVYSYLQLNPEGYVSCRDLADAWNCNINTVNSYCRKGLIPGAKKRRGSGSHGYQRWIIPAEAQRPQSKK